MAYVGTGAWCELTQGGVLRVRDKIELFRLATTLGVSQLPGYVFYRLGVPPLFRTPVKFDDFAEPDGVAARLARDRLAEIADSYLIAHSLRTYWLSRFLASYTGRDFDDELLYVASLAHDVGLLDPPGTSLSDAACFSIRGAAWAVEIARHAGWDERRAASLADAITLNLNGWVAKRRGFEAHLMMQGVLIDVIGFYARRLPRATLAAIYADAPLQDQRRRLASAFLADADQYRLCRGYFSAHRLCFAYLMRHAPKPPKPARRN